MVLDEPFDSSGPSQRKGPLEVAELSWVYWGEVLGVGQTGFGLASFFSALPVGDERMPCLSHGSLPQLSLGSLLLFLARFAATNFAVTNWMSARSCHCVASAHGIEWLNGLRDRGCAGSSWRKWARSALCVNNKSATWSVTQGSVTSQSKVSGVYQQILQIGSALHADDEILDRKALLDDALKFAVAFPLSNERPCG